MRKRASDGKLWMRPWYGKSQDREWKILQRYKWDIGCAQTSTYKFLPQIWICNKAVNDSIKSNCRTLLSHIS